MFGEFDTDEMIDEADNIGSDVDEPSDTADGIDEMLDSMTLDQLYELRDSLTEPDISDGGENPPDVSDLEPIEETESPDYSFHWDGGPTHDTDLDEDEEPSPYIRKLIR